jgi:hypothetical protein
VPLILKKGVKAMIRGGNIEYRWNLPYNFSDLAVVKINFWQEGYNGPSAERPLPILKVLEQCRQGSKPTELSVILHQEETLRFTDKRKAKVQLRAVTTSGIPIITHEQLITVYPAYDDSILDEEIWPTPDYNGWVLLDGESVV